MRVGNKKVSWDTTRAKLKKKFQEMGITSCELRMNGCTPFQFLGFAHTKKRADIKTQEDLEDVVLACTNCHQKVEFGRGVTHKMMYDKLKEVISGRFLEY